MFQKTVLSPFVLRPPSLRLFVSSTLRLFDSLTLSLFVSLTLLSDTGFSLPHKKRGLTSKSLSFDAMSCVYAAVRLSKLVTGRHFKDVL